MAQILHLKEKMPALNIKAYTSVYLKDRSVERNINYSIENDGMLPKLFYETTSPWQKNSLQCRRKIEMQIYIYKYSYRDDKILVNLISMKRTMQSFILKVEGWYGCRKFINRIYLIKRSQRKTK